MRYALDQATGERIEATLGTRRATCPTCHGTCIAKTGAINAWHWAHEAADCDTWAEPDSRWHRWWQDQFPARNQELNFGPHRVDVGINGTLLEIQHSHLSVDEIRERENYYGSFAALGAQFIWLFDAVEAYDQERLELRASRSTSSRYRTFRWKHARKSIGACRHQVYLDLGNGWTLRLGRISPEGRVGGWGHLVTYDEFLDSIHR